MPNQLSPPLADHLFEHAACGLLCTDADGVILRINQTACSWLGYESGQLVGQKRLRDLLTVGARLFHQTHCLPILQLQGSVAEVQVDLVRHDQSRVPVLMNIVRSAAGGNIVDSVALITSNDRRAYERELLKARKAAEAALEERRGFEARLAAMNNELERADRRKDQFLATLAHELRNPLAPIR
ncbi:MAG TPA: PAS domain-containing protein, partial [Ramlibacter sp.]|nr:PAS domain-containing protein [Ramlibacter sp.]